MVIADFEGDKAEARTGLSLWPYADEQFGGTSEARVTLIHPGAEGSKSAVRVSFLVTDDSPTPFAGAWAMIGPEGLATDVSAYRGVRFHARGKDQTAFTFGIVRFPGQIRRYMAPFEVRPEWTRIELPFEKFVLMNTLGQTATDTTRLDAKDITSIGVSVAPRLRGRFEIDIDQLELYR